ncbi:MAG TPA: FAD-dependent oxidoreductase [Gaiellaceae bacterium]|nr:FAD-dependent oxidoreductase [Gaiellaceae bacterium]
MRPGTVVIVGAGLAGSRCAETLRAEGFDGRVVLVGEERAAPYERPALSKEYLAGERESVELRSAGFWEERGIELVLGRRVEAIDLGGKTAGPGLEWDALVLATGARARQLPFPCPSGVLTLRTLADAERLGGELAPGKRLAVIGAGFVGAEVTSTARSLGVEVALVDLAAVPLERVLGPEVGAILAERFQAHGVDLRLGRGLGRFLEDASGRVRGLELTDGSEVACDVALVAVGAEPATEPLGGAPAGVLTDACGRTGVADVYACGDVASSWRPSISRSVRVEHWTSAAGQAAAVAHAILGRERPYDDLPYFWSDQFGLRLQHVGHAEDWAAVELEGDADAFGARYLDGEGRLLAALLANRPREVGALRRELAAGAVEEAA